MGGHGAWMSGVNSPDSFTCASVAAGWVNKEEYGSANSFFSLDISTSYVDPEVKAILERAMSEFHVDRLAGNLKFKDIHVRVGSADPTTHPWFSRRMQRLMISLGINSTVRFE